MNNSLAWTKAKFVCTNEFISSRYRLTPGKEYKIEKESRLTEWSPHHIVVKNDSGDLVGPLSSGRFKLAK